LLGAVKMLLVTKGRKVVRHDLARSRPSDDDLAALLLGPSGNLRAPTLRTGHSMMVGFNEEMYAEVLAGG
jgi:arsenate reductase-like glutaredoxin family protein